MKPKRAKGKGRKAKSRGQRAKGALALVSDRELRTLRKQIEKQSAMRWNPDADDVQRSVVKLVLTLVELIRKLMERQAIRRMEARTMTAAETEAVGKALMEIERTVRDIGRKFDLSPEDLNLDLGAIKLL